MKIQGDLILTKKNQKDFRNLTEVSGYIDVHQGATFTAPNLTEVSGSVYVLKDATFTAPNLTEVSGYVDVQEGATFTAPNLTEVSGSVYVQEGATFTAPALTKSGSVYVHQGATLTAPNLTEVSGYVDVQEGATFTAPALTKSGSVYVHQGATLTAPNLTVKNGFLKIKNKEYKVNLSDGVLMFIENSKTSNGIKISSGINQLKIINNEAVYGNLFLAEKEGFFSHGITLKRAISDLKFKIISEKLKNEPIKEDTLLTVKYYRLITGACDAGTRDFMQRNGLEFEIVDGETKEIHPIKAKDLLTLLEKNNAYGVDKFKSLYEA